VTLPETTPERISATDPVPPNPSLTALVTATAGEGASPVVQLYVDSHAPAISFSMPTCGAVLRPASGTSVTQTFTVVSDALPVTLTLSGGGAPIVLTETTYASPTFRTVMFRNVVLGPGRWDATVAATDPANNVGHGPAMCRFDVGNPPIVTFVQPTDRAMFGATGDTAPGTPGFQGATVRVQTDAPPGTAITLTINGATPVTQNADAMGVATFTGVSLPEGDAVALDAVTADVPTRGVGRASITVAVDTQPPGSPAALVGTVQDRRAGTIRLTFNNASDPGTPPRAVARYEARYSNAAITDANFAMATAVSVPPTPGAPGTPALVDVRGLQLGLGYFFAVRAVDVGGNASPVATAGPVTADILSLRVVDAAAHLGTSVTGGFDVNGDGIDDVVVGGLGGQARIYFGSATGLSETNFTVISGATGADFGVQAASIGDFDGDSLGDVVVAERGAFNTAPGRVLIYLGRPTTGPRTWPPSTSPLTAADADVVINGGVGDFATANFGWGVARIGDFNGDTRADLAIGAPNADNGALDRAGAAYVYLGRAIPAATPRPVMLNSTTDAAVTIRGAEALLQLGITIGGTSRLVGGDMLEDLNVNASGGDNRGITYVFAGRAVPTPVNLTVTDAVFTRTGAAGELFNRTAAVGDINADGLNDFVIGRGVGVGSLSLFFGDASGGLTMGPVMAHGPAFGATDTFGISAARIADAASIRPSLLFGTPRGADLGVGMTLYLGMDPVLMMFAARASWTGVASGNADYRLTAPRGGSVTSSPVQTPSWVGDINRDGFPDLAFGQSGQNAFFVLY
jgi:hypothetical protein